MSFCVGCHVSVLLPAQKSFVHAVIDWHRSTWQRHSPGGRMLPDPGQHSLAALLLAVLAPGAAGRAGWEQQAHKQEGPPDGYRSHAAEVARVGVASHWTATPSAHPPTGCHSASTHRQRTHPETAQPAQRTNLRPPHPYLQPGCPRAMGSPGRGGRPGPG